MLSDTNSRKTSGYTTRSESASGLSPCAGTHRSERVPGREQVARERVEPAPCLQRERSAMPRGERIGQALDELVVLHVAAGHEVKDQIAARPAIQPGLVRLEPVDYARVR